jgi:predicted 2-oxoglutarate/Fe(II)-dependent dioxygenase YbiX
VSAGVTGAVRDRLAELLGGVEGRGASNARSTLPADSLHMEVRGVGELGFPVAQAQARQLCAIARPARYGRGEDTVLDRRVRDTWEVPKSRVKIDKRRWHRAMRPALDRFRRVLGLTEGCELTADPHSMLVYGPGQFFVPHQDSETDDAMVGSLVVTLPSSFTGGDLVVHSGTGTKRYRSSKTALTLVAFYADCRHEIQPVRSGYRIVLTYNLLLRGEPTTDAGSDVDAATVDGVASCLDEHFTTPMERRWRMAGPPEDPPSRLVYLLDHEYTRRGMHWSRLKGGDAPRAAVLRAAAEKAGCEVVLALADVHETWSAFEPDHHSRDRGSMRRRWDFDEPEDEDDWFGEDTPFDAGETSDLDKYELDELIEAEVTVDAWTGPEGGPARPVSSSVANGEVCASTSTEDLVPYAAEYEGYMGNYGNTLDRWYHRGALVVWPRRLAFKVRAEAAPTWAIDELAGLLDDGETDLGRQHAASMAPIWADAVHGTAPDATFVGAALHAAGMLADADLAAMLVAPFPLSAIDPEHAEPLVRLGDTYGTAWMCERVDRWSATAARFGRAADQLAWTGSLPRVCDPLAAAGPVGLSIARILARRSWLSLRNPFEQRRSLTPPSRAQEALLDLAAPVLGLLDAASMTGHHELCDEVTAFLTDNADGTGDLLACTMAILRDAPARDPASRAAAGLHQLAHHCRTRLEARTSRPPRADDDWSVSLPSGCDCNLCQTLCEFLADRTRQIFEWPIAQAKRQHIHRRIDDAELSVRHQTRRRGSPYTLVLTKTDELFIREGDARRQDEADLAWLAASGMLT